MDRALNSWDWHKLSAEVTDKLTDKGCWLKIDVWHHLKSNICVRFQHSTVFFCSVWLTYYANWGSMSLCPLHPWLSICQELIKEHNERIKLSAVAWQAQHSPPMKLWCLSCEETLSVTWVELLICAQTDLYSWLWNGTCTLFPISQELTQANATKAQVQGLVR